MWTHRFLQYFLPHHIISRCMGWICDCQWAAYKNWMIRRFIRVYGVEMNSVLEPDITKYPSFNHFFIRHLKPGARPIAPGDTMIISPVDGSISEMGDIHVDRVIQAKRHTYTTTALLGGDKTLASLFADGQFMTLYLAPNAYHRVHMPLSGELEKMIYVPGRLFSVCQQTTETVPRLFARNERIIALFKTKAGPMAVVMVGAMCVGSIHTTWAGRVTPNHHRYKIVTEYAAPIFLQKGDEMGYFSMGSTVIILFPGKTIQWEESLSVNSIVQMGQLVGCTR